MASKEKVTKTKSAELGVWRNRKALVSRVSSVGLTLTLVAGFTFASASSASAHPHETSSGAENETSGAENQVLISAQKLKSGNLEFGIRVGGEELSPKLRNRYLPYERVVVGKWYYSEERVVGQGGCSVLVEVQVRRMPSGNVEFGLRLDRRREWLPRARFFPYDTPVGQVLLSSIFDTTEYLIGCNDVGPPSPPNIVILVES